MPKSKHMRNRVVVRMSFIAVCLIVAADRVDAESVTITNYWNSKTRDTVEFNANVDDLIIFRVKANQDINTWHWFLNGKKQAFFVNEGKTTWYLSNKEAEFCIWAKGDKTTYIDTVKVYGKNANGTTQTITWTIRVSKQRGTISGKVTNVANEPLAGVSVGMVGYSTVTDANGKYILANIPEGTFLLVAHKDKYVWATQKVKVDTDKTTTCDLQLASFKPATVTSIGSNIYIKNGDATLTTINDALNKPALLEKTAAKQWLLKVSIYVQGPAGRLYITDSDCDLLKMQGKPTPILIRADNGGSIFIGSTSVTGWNITNNKDITLTDSSPTIESWYDSMLNVTGTHFKHVGIRYIRDKTPDMVDNCTFLETNRRGIIGSHSLHKTITHNRFIDCYFGSYSETNWDPTTVEDVYTYTNFSHNYCKGTKGYSVKSDNVQIGSGSTIVGNEIILGGWNIINRGSDTLLRGNIIHDNAGHHNGFNPGGARARRITHIDDYAYNIKRYTGFYFQRSPNLYHPQYERIINSVAENCSAGFLTYKMYNSYLYNFTSINNGGNSLLYDSRNVTFEKCNISGCSWGGMEFLDKADEGYPHDCMFINSKFKNNDPADICMKFNNFDGAVVYSINTYNETTKDAPTIRWSYPKGEFRDYVWLDVLVRDEKGKPLPAVKIAIRNLKDAKYPALDVVPVESFLDIDAIISRTDWGDKMRLPSKKTFTSVNTGSNGHTPLPKKGNAIAMMFQKRTKTGTISGYTYKITASHKGYKPNEAIVKPDKSWYRPDPNKPTKTVILTFTDLISGRHIFYNNSSFDGNKAAANADDDKAIATDKSALLPG